MCACVCVCVRGRRSSRIKASSQVLDLSSVVPQKAGRLKLRNHSVLALAIVPVRDGKGFG